MRFRYSTVVIKSYAAWLALLAWPAAAQDRYHGWTAYGGGPENIRYSTLKQIDRGNVQKLTVAWTFETGDSFKNSEMQCNPIVVNGILYATTPKMRVIALDAATGKLRWSFDPNEQWKGVRKARNRGVTYWESGADRRILFVSRQWLYAVDAGTGKPIASFGDGGRVDLRDGLGRDPATLTVSGNHAGHHL